MDKIRSNDKRGFGGKKAMGTYLNPGNSGFARIRNDIYVDKSGLMAGKRKHRCRIEKYSEKEA